MGWGILLAVTALAFVLLSGPVGAAVDGWTNARCLNSTHLYLWDDLGMSGRTLQANTTMDCSPYTCNNLTETCDQPYQMTAVQADFSLFFFVFFFVSAIAGLYYGAAREKKHVILCMYSTIIFFIIALQSIAMDAVFVGTFFAGLTPVLIGVSLLLAMVSLLATLIGAVKYAKGKGQKNELEAQVQYGRY